MTMSRPADLLHLKLALEYQEELRVSERNRHHGHNNEIASFFVRNFQASGSNER